MSITDLTVIRAIREKMKFHETRQRVLSENVANATTPGYRGRDVEAPDFFRIAAEVRRDNAVPAAVTNARHIAGAPISNAGSFKSNREAGYEVTPDGNAVVLEEQMMKVAENQMDYQVAASLYQRGLGLLRTAIGRG